MRRRLALTVFCALLVGLQPGFAAGEDDPTPIPDSVRRASIKRIGRDLNRKATSARAPRYKPVILELLTSLEVLGGPEVGEAALKAVPLVDQEVRDRIFELVETHYDEDVVAPLGALLESKDYRRDYDLKRRICHALSVIASDGALPFLTDLIRTDEDANVVASAADALATFAGAPLSLRKDAVKRLVDVYTSTWNLMMSIRPEDRVMSARMKDRYRIYGRAVRTALQALTGAQLSRPQEWREWWNDNKKRTDW